MIAEEYLNPFPGLRSFEEEEEYLFFGREQQVDDLLAKIEDTHFLAVVGASGSGKSSLVKCGLLPAFHSGFLRGVGKGWRIGVFRPGDDPIGNLASSFCSEELIGSNEDEEQVDQPIVESILRRSDEGILNVVDQFLSETEENLLLVVDQFEEIFRFSKYEKKSNRGTRDSVAFINLLLKAIKDKTKRVYVVITMRSDFLGNCTEFRGLPEAINEGQYLIPRMNRNEKKLAITGPVAVGGGQISASLVALLLNEVGDNPDQLPIMQHALMRTWDYWSKNASPEKPLDVHDYEAIGRMENALSFHADEAYNGLDSDEEREICSRLFKSLTETGTNLGGIRRPTKLGELQKLLNVPADTLIRIIDAFRDKERSFLMPPAYVPLTEDTVIDISHESLMRVWKRLNTWVKEEAESAETYKAIANAAALHQEGKGGLYRDPELQFALLWLKKNNPTEEWAARYDSSFMRAVTFLKLSKEEYEFEIAQQELIQKRRIKRNKLFTIVLSIAAIVAIGFGIDSFLAKQDAERATEKAIRSEQLARESEQRAKEQEEIALREKKEALNQKNRADDARAEAETNKERAEQSADEARREKLKAEIAEAAAKQDRKMAVVAKDSAEVAKAKAIANEMRAKALRNQAKAQNLAFESTLKLDKGEINLARQSAINAYYLNDSSGGPFLVDDIYIALTRSLYSADSANLNAIGNYKYQVKDISVHPTDGTIAMLNEIGEVTIAKPSNELELKPAGSVAIKREARALAFSPDGKILAVGDYDGVIHLLSKNSGKSYEQKSTLSTSGIVNHILWLEADRRRLLVVETSVKTVVYDYSSDTPMLLTFNYNGAPPTNIIPISATEWAFTQGTKVQLATVNLSKTALSLSAETMAQYSQTVTAIAYLSDGNMLAVGLLNGLVYLIDVQSKVQKMSSVVVHASRVSDLSFYSYKGNEYLITCSYDGTAQLIYLNKSGSKKIESAQLAGNYFHSNWLYKVDSSKDGKHFFTASKDGKVKMWFTESADITQILEN